MKEFFVSHQSQLLQTLVLVVSCLVIYFVVKQIAMRFRREKDRVKWTSRTKIILSAAILVVILLVWIPGFWSVIAVLGFAAGALVLTQKFNIQNLVGYLIISWRELFQIGDIIAVSEYLGKVKSIGPFYFTVYEVNMEYHLTISGNVIKIPNGVVSKSPVKNYSEIKIHKLILSYVFQRDTRIDDLAEFISNILPKMKEALVESGYEADEVDRVQLSNHYYIKQVERTGIKVTLIIEAPLDLLCDIQQIIERILINEDQQGKIKLVF